MVVYPDVDGSRTVYGQHLRQLDLTRRLEQKVGMPVTDYFDEYTYPHHQSARVITEELFPIHYLPYPDR